MRRNKKHTFCSHWFTTTGLLTLLFLFGCTHTIAPLPVEIPHSEEARDGSLYLVIPSDTANYVSTHRNLSGDTWNLQIGSAVADIFPKVFLTEFKTVLTSQDRPLELTPNDLLVQVEIDSFVHDIGMTIFSDHDGTLTIKLKPTHGEEKKLTVTASDSARTDLKTYAGLIVAGFGLSAYNESIARMLSQTALEAAIQSLVVVKQWKQGPETISGEDTERQSQEIRTRLLEMLKIGPQ